MPTSLRQWRIPSPRSLAVARVVLYARGMSESGDGATKTEMAPTPFTAAQIRDATRNGRRYEWKVEANGKPTQWLEITFHDVDANGATIYRGGRDDEEQPMTTTAVPVTWEELQGHARFPAGATTRSEGSVTTPAGTYDCVVYRVTTDDGSLRVFYFAKSMPGAPVLHYSERNGERLETSTLVAHSPGE